MLLFIILLVFMLVGILAAWGFMGLWVYRDAKNRGLEAGMWALIAMVAPNLIGLLLYFILGRGKTQVLCRSCGSKAPCAARYCPQCGQPMTVENIEQAAPKQSAKGPLVCMAVFFSIFVISLAAMGILSFTNGGMASFSAQAPSAPAEQASWRPNSFVGLLDVKFGNEWCLSYYYSSKDLSRTITIPEGAFAIGVTGRCKEGEAQLVLAQDGKEASLPLGPQEETGQIPLTGFSAGKAQLTVRQKDARGVSLTAKVI